MSVDVTHLHADVCVVGAGIVGLSHALEARRRGLSVVVLDRDGAAVGASIANFGHLFFSSQPDGPVLDLALRSRARWLELADRARLALTAAGTLIVARAEDELAVLETALSGGERDARLLTPSQAQRLAPVSSEGLTGALHCGVDLRVDPRRAVGALATLLEEDPRATLVWNTRLTHAEPGAVEAASASGPPARTRVRAPIIIACPGPDAGSLPAELRGGLENLTRCRLQMLRLGAEAGLDIAPALATGLSLVRYPAFASQAPAAALRRRLVETVPELLDAGIHLLITQLPDGDLVVGDSHAYGETLAPFGEERVWDLLLDEAERLLGRRLPVRQRWLGIYPSRVAASEAYEPFHVTRPMDGVRIVENVAGIGMTLSPGFAAQVLDELLEGAALGAGVS